MEKGKKKAADSITEYIVTRGPKPLVTLDEKEAENLLETDREKAAYFLGHMIANKVTTLGTGRAL